jgi:hypothetical protein
LDYSLRYE